MVEIRSLMAGPLIRGSDSETGGDGGIGNGDIINAGAADTDHSSTDTYSGGSASTDHSSTDTINGGAA